MQDDPGAGIKPGLVWAYAMGPDGPGRELAPHQIEAALAAGSGWTWLHLDLLDQRARAWVGQVCDLPEAARLILEGHEDDLALDHEEGVVHGVCADFENELGYSSTKVGRLYFAVSDRVLVTGRRHPLASVSKVHEAIQAGRSFATPFDLFGAIVEAFRKTASRHLATMSARLDAVEDHVFDEAVRNDRRELMAVRRLAVNVHRPIAALVHVFDDEDRIAWALSEDAREVLRRLSGQLVALDRDVIIVGDRARLLYEEVVAQLADESNRSLKALAIMSALLLPGSLVAGIFGMNVAGLPLVETTAGFFVAMLLGISATLGFYWLLRRAGVTFKL